MFQGLAIIKHLKSGLFWRRTNPIDKEHQVSLHSKFLFLTLLALLVLTQMVILGWTPEAVFFVTWLFLALTVQHDSRISASMGLAFLATCPFLLITEKETVAEQAANYAYFFLAIGVLVQLEEMLLERYGGLSCKLDLSDLWQPVDEILRRRWTAAGQALGQQLATADRTELVRLIQIVGTAGLALTFVGAALSGSEPAIVLPLLGGALLFPFIIWIGRLMMRALGPTWLMRAALALVVLPLAAAEMIWLHDLASADRLSRMQITYDFIDQLEQVGRANPAPEGETIEVRFWTIEEKARRVLYQHPAFTGASQLTYSVSLERGAKLAFAVATAPESWQYEGDGVTFTVYVKAVQGIQQLYSIHLDPYHHEADRSWRPVVIDLSAYAGQDVTLIFETNIGPAGDYRYDWAGWGEPRLVQPGAYDTWRNIFSREKSSEPGLE